MCDLGFYQPESNYMFSHCIPCPNGTFADVEGSAECKPCEKPHCAKVLLSCNPRTGQDPALDYYNQSEAISVACGEQDDNPCSLRHCMPNTAQCSANPTVYDLQIDASLPPATRCAHDLSHRPASGAGLGLGLAVHAALAPR